TFRHGVHTRNVWHECTTHRRNVFLYWRRGPARQFAGTRGVGCHSGGFFCHRSAWRARAFSQTVLRAVVDLAGRDVFAFGAHRVRAQFSPRDWRAARHVSFVRVGRGMGVGENWECEMRSSECEMRKAALQYFAYALIGASLLVSAFWNGRAYFVDWASSSGLFYSFDAG